MIYRLFSLRDAGISGRAFRPFIGTNKQMREGARRFAATVRTAFVYLSVVALTGCGGNSGVQKDPADTIGNVRFVTIDSAKTGAAYPLYVYVPESYARGTATYPVIYATDGDAGFPPEGRFANFRKILQRHGIDAILVGIGGTARRNKDFLLPGARAYHEFLTQELIPFVETRLRADPKRRILSGVSFGGVFVVTALFLEAPGSLYFSHYISAEGSFFVPSFVTQERDFTRTFGTKSIPATLILARGAESSKVQPEQFAMGGAKGMPALSNLSLVPNEFTNHSEVDSFYRRMTSRHYADLVLIETSFSTDHIGTDNPSFEDAMVRIFGK
jgi:predicted alpha/beta superfamily hydrolase